MKISPIKDESRIVKPDGVSIRRRYAPSVMHKKTEEDKEFIRAMNKFVEQHGTITDDEFFRVL